MTPLERAARALCAEAFQDPDEIVTTVGDKPVYAWEHKTFAARAVIEAIREPSEAMVDEGGVSIARQFTDPWDVLSPEEEETFGLEVDGDDAFEGANVRLRPYAADCHRAMIDALLAEGGK